MVPFSIASFIDNLQLMYKASAFFGNFWTCQVGPEYPQNGPCETASISTRQVFSDLKSLKFFGEEPTLGALVFLLLLVAVTHTWL